jgi:uncharacterized protein YdiU (UPF0061 family)
MDAYDPATVFSSIDQNGRYAYGNQPRIGQWNLTRLAETLVPLLAEDPKDAVELAETALGKYPAKFEAVFHAGLRHKLGLTTEQDDDVPLIGDLLKLMADNKADFTLTFRRLSDAAADTEADSSVRTLFSDPTAYDGWAVRWRQRLGQDPLEGALRKSAMQAVNPAFIPRNHRVEAIIQAALNDEDFRPFEELLAVLSRPFEDQPSLQHYAEPPQPHERVLATFCGT